MPSSGHTRTSHAAHIRSLQALLRWRGGFYSVQYMMLVLPVGEFDTGNSKSSISPALPLKNLPIRRVSPMIFPSCWTGPIGGLFIGKGYTDKSAQTIKAIHKRHQIRPLHYEYRTPNGREDIPEHAAIQIRSPTRMHIETPALHAPPTPRCASVSFGLRAFGCEMR